MQRTGASRFAQRQIQRHRRLAPVADLAVRSATENLLMKRLSQSITVMIFLALTVGCSTTPALHAIGVHVPNQRGQARIKCPARQLSGSAQKRVAPHFYVGQPRF